MLHHQNVDGHSPGHAVPTISPGDVHLPHASCFRSPLGMPNKLSFRSEKLPTLPVERYSNNVGMEGHPSRNSTSLWFPWAHYNTHQTSPTRHDGFLGKHPQLWSKEEVREWLKWCIDYYSLSDVHIEKFNMNGKALCMLNKENFCDRAPNVGDVLYNTLQKLVASSASTPSTHQDTPLAPLDLTHPVNSYNVIPAAHASTSVPSMDIFYTSGSSFTSGSETLSITGSRSAHPPASHPCTIQMHQLYQEPKPLASSMETSQPLNLTITPRSLEDKSSHTLPSNIIDEKQSPEMLTRQPIHAHTMDIEDRIVHGIPPKKRAIQRPTPLTPGNRLIPHAMETAHPGMPPGPPAQHHLHHNPPPGEAYPGSLHPGMSGDNMPIHTSAASTELSYPAIPRMQSMTDFGNPYTGVVSTANSDCRLLWEFINELLMDSKYEQYIRWENRETMVFRIVNPTGLAKLWGRQKNRSNMTYEKLSRALRYYYRMNIISKVPGRRLTYKFLTPPQNIKKGVRGARPGVPHHRRQSSPDQDINGLPETSLSPPRSASVTSLSFNPESFPGTPDSSMPPRPPLGSSSSGTPEEFFYSNPESQPADPSPFTPEPRPCPDWPLNRLSQCSDEDLPVMVKGEYDTPVFVNAEVGQYRERVVTPHGSSGSDCTGGMVASESEHGSSPSNGTVSPSDRLSREFNEHLSVNADQGNNNNTQKYENGNPS